MKSSTILRWCLALEWILFLFGAFANCALRSRLPEPLVAWLKVEDMGDSTTGELVLLAISLSLLVAMIVATAGLFCLRRWAAWLYLISFVLGIVIMALSGPNVEHAIASAFDDIGTALSGIVIALAFFTDSLKKSAAEQSPPPLPRNLQTGHSE